MYSKDQSSFAGPPLYFVYLSTLGGIIHAQAGPGLLELVAMRSTFTSSPLQHRSVLWRAFRTPHVLPKYFGTLRSPPSDKGEDTPDVVSSRVKETCFNLGATHTLYIS